MTTQTTFTVEEFQDRFDELFDRVMNGETLTIISPSGNEVKVVNILSLPQG
jgi:phosphoheptose isomerase